MRRLVLCLALGLPAFAQAQEAPRPTAWTQGVAPLDAVEQIVMPAVDVDRLKQEDDREFRDTAQKSMRYAATIDVDVTPETNGTWERLPDGRWLWRLRVQSKHALSLNFGFKRYHMPAGGTLFIYSADGKHVYRPFTADDNEDHGQLWTPPVFGEETVLEVTLPDGARDALELRLAFVNHDYRGFGRPNMEKSGACNIDIVCPISNPYNDQERANAVISTGGSRFCSGSLLNNTANDAKPFFSTAAHCGITAGNAASLVTFWNYFNSTCRPQGGGNSPPGDGSLAQFNTGSFFRAANAQSDFTLVELDDPLSPAFNLYLAGWDRTPMPTQFNATVAIHQPNTEEMRITFAPGLTESGGWPPAVPGDGSHIHAIWGPNLGVTEPGSSGSPLYTQQGRYIGQLHGGPSACGAADLSDFYGRFSLSWTGGNLQPWLDPANTGQITLDGRNACTFPAAPAGVTATATAPNTIQVTWNTVAGATYTVLRAVGACPQTNYTQIATGLTGTSYTDNTVSGGITYSYVVRSVVTGCPSLNSNCDDAVATGGCTLAPTFAGLTSVTSAGTAACALNLAWPAATPTCPTTTVKYNVYRSLTPGFTPGAATLRQSCVTGTTFQDATVNSGTRYYYVVRAEDSQSNGSGACNSGVQDANLQERNAVPGGPATTVTDDVEAGGTAWDATGGTGGNPWTIVTTAAHSPTHSWFWPDPAVVTLQPLARVASFAFGPGGGRLSWWHRVETESTFDGYVAEYSLDNGTTWSDILLGQGTVPANPNRFLSGAYNAVLSTGFGNPLPGRAAWSGTIGSPAFAEVVVDMNDFAGRSVKVRFRAGSDNSVSATGIWIDDVVLSSVGACNTVPAQAVAPFGLYMLSGSGDTVLRPNNVPVIMAPIWRNVGSSPIALTGAVSSFNGPTPATYLISDGAAAYGAFAPGTVRTCVDSADCYTVQVSAAVRPVTHWDGTILETVTPTSSAKTWTLHIGDSFTDVPATSPFFRFIEILLHRPITGGCSQTAYCPSNSTTRDQMAVFVLLSKEAPGYVPAACVAGSEAFNDVPATSPFCRWIEELARRGVVSGCGGGAYCPSSAVTREQMAIFVLKTLDPALVPPACAPPNTYNDVPETSPFCRWIEELTTRGVVSGCGGGNYCPTAAVTREQMGVFLSVTFGLSLYGL
jgi:lysyl endopeptidase